jgi:hypothetical protein
MPAEPGTSANVRATKMTDNDQSCIADCAAEPPGDLLSGYARVAEESRRMMLAAEQGNWDEVERTEAACRELIEEIRELGTPDRLDAGQDRRRMQILGMILADDARVRLSLEPWLAELEQFLGTPRHMDTER